MLAGKPKKKRKTTRKTATPIVQQQTTPSISTKTSDWYIYFHIKPFRDNEMGVNHWDTITRNMTSLGARNIIFWIAGNQTGIKLYARVPKDFANYFQNTFYANYPSSDLVLIDPIPLPATQEYIHFSDEGVLNTKSDFTKDWSYMDPMSDILALYNNIEKGSELSLYYQYTFKREGSIWDTIDKMVGKIANYLLDKKEDDKKEDKEKEKEENKLEMFISCSFHIRNADEQTKAHITQNIISVYTPFAKDNDVKIKKEEKFKWVAISQVVNFFHIPTKANFIKWLEYTLYKKLPYPTNLSTLENSAKGDITILGTTDYRAEKISFGIRKEDKLRHIYIVGKTGTGKSTLLSNMVKSDMNSNNGLALLDPHGDLIDTALEHIPNHRINDVVLFDVSDSDHPIWFNLLQYENDDEKNRIVSWVVATFYKLFAHSWGPRLEYILRNVLLSIVEYPNATLMHILRILVDQWFRDEVIAHVKDPLVLKFWQNEFNKRDPRQREEAIAPITNKIGQFLSSSVVRNIFGQPRSKLNLRKAMDEGKIILVNLSKGKIGEDNAAMIGSLLVTKFQIDAMARADVSYTQRKDFYLYIDEFQNFATSSFATILSEARKYKLSLIVANQFINQLLPEIKDAIFGNIGTIISFTLGHDDASALSSQYKEIVAPNDLISLPKFTAYTKLMIDGITSDPFSMKTMPLSQPENSKELKEKILKQSRQRYAMQKDELETLMNAWNKKTFSAQEKIADKAKLESLGLSEAEAALIQDPHVQAYMHLLEHYSIDKEQGDAVIFDLKDKRHKLVYNKKIPDIDKHANFVKNMNGIDVYLHKTQKDERNEALMVLVWKKEDIINMIAKIPHMKYTINVNKLWFKPSDTPTPKEENKEESFLPQIPKQQQFTIKDIKIGQEYEWYVKLLYNYGIFVTVKGVEWLLHKNYINSPKDVDRKKYFNIGDKIKVKAKEFKDIKGEKKVVWSMK